MSSTSNNHGDRLTRVETSLGNLATQLGDFVRESHDFRKLQEHNQGKIWEAIEKIANKGALSWQVVAMTLGLALTMICTAATLGHSFMESRMKQVEIHLEYQKEAILRNRDRLDGMDERLSSPRP